MNEMLSRLGGAALNDMRGTPLDSILNQLMNGQQGASGLQALVDRLRQGGLGPQVDSWVGEGENADVAPQDLERALGAEEIGRMSQATGVPQQGMSGILAALLPMLINALTPRGQLPTRDEELPSQGSSGGLGGILGGILGQLGGGGGQAPTSGTGSLQDILGSLLGGRGTQR
ncbi:YidB family protein [Roseomonas sp. OT10]|nr:YidB family protein [Roseomonas sp. OT10]UFN50336.1 YidB family protein [Roseomonas sp. OT10]